MKFKLIPLLFFALLAGSTFAQMPTLERVEPMNWWAGMKNPKLQLLVHGNKIGERGVKMSYPGVRLVQVHKVANPNYLFLDLDISAAVKPGAFTITFTKPRTADIKYKYELRQRDHAANRAQGVTDKDLIYLIMPDRFSNGDPKNDAVPGMAQMKVDRSQMYERHGGDIQGVMNHLDYLKDLGVTAVWLTPAVTNDMPHASYHGYAVTDHYHIDPRFGTNELYKAFVDKCHKMGLKVVLDLVHNHAGINDFFIKDMPMKSWVHQWPKYTNSNFRDATVMDPHASAIDRKVMLDGWFDHSMADMNENNPYVENYLTQNHIWWTEYAGVDGFRLDTYPYNDAVYMADWAKKVKAEFPHLSIFGETLVWSVPNQAFFTEGNTVNRGFDTGLPGVVDSQMKDAINEALNGPNDWAAGVNKLYLVLSQDFLYKDPTRNVVMLDNHDMSRFYTVVGEDFTKYKSGMALLLTTRGIPQMYYGDEILMAGEDNPDGLVRSDFPGGWPSDKENKFTSAGRTDKENEAFNYVRTLANYRKNTPALQTGKLMQYIPQNGIYVYFRYDAAKTVMIIYNSEPKEQTLNTDRFSERMAGFGKAKNVINNETFNTIQAINIPGKTTFVLELQK